MSWVRPPLPTPKNQSVSVAPCRFRAVERQSSYFSAGLDHVIRHNITVNVHGGADVRVPHGLLLDGDRGPHSIQPGTEGVAHGVSSNETNTSAVRSLLKHVQDSGI